MKPPTHNTCTRLAQHISQFRGTVSRIYIYQYGTDPCCCILNQYPFITIGRPEWQHDHLFVHRWQAMLLQPLLTVAITGIGSPVILMNRNQRFSLPETFTCIERFSPIVSPSNDTILAPCVYDFFFI